MRINKNLFALLALFTIIAGSALLASAQIAGGYGEVSTTEKAVRDAARFAVSNKNMHSYQTYQLAKILKAEQQVVAGMNYKMCLSVKELGTGDTENFEAVVYVNLKRKRELTSWAKSDCAPAGSPSTEPKIPMAGGYKTVEPTDEGARAAAEWAVRHQGEKEGKGIELMTLVKAQQQVVAGMNYRLCMRVNTEDAEKPDSFVEAVVYRSLQQEYKLTSWKGDSTCGDGAE